MSFLSNFKDTTFEKNMRYIMSKEARAKAQQFLATQNITTGHRMLLTAAVLHLHPAELVQGNDQLGQELIVASNKLFDNNSLFVQHFGSFVIKLNEWKKQDLPVTIEGLKMALDCYRLEKQTYLKAGNVDGLRDVTNRARGVVQSLKMLNIDVTF